MPARSCNMLVQSEDKWGKSRGGQAKVLFGLFPQVGEVYSLVCAIYKMHILREEAKEKLYDWYKNVNVCTLREVKAIRNVIKSKEERSTLLPNHLTRK